MESLAVSLDPVAPLALPPDVHRDKSVDLLASDSLSQRTAPATPTATDLLRRMFGMRTIHAAVTPSLRPVGGNPGMDTRRRPTYLSGGALGDDAGDQTPRRGGAGAALRVDLMHWTYTSRPEIDKRLNWSQGFEVLG